jgi:hypothetical protein
MPKGGDLYFTLVPDHKHIQLYIKDTGVGMDSEQVNKRANQDVLLVLNPYRLLYLLYITEYAYDQELIFNERKRYWTWNDGRIQCCSSYEWKN